MFDIIRSVLSAGGYRLADMQYKIKKLYALGDLTEKEMDQLLALASVGATAEAERPQVLTMLTALAEKITGLETRLKTLEGGENGEETWPAWEPWNGISENYQSGTVVTHKGKTWISTFQGQNVWEPGTVDETFWAEYEEVCL